MSDGVIEASLRRTVIQYYCISLKNFDILHKFHMTLKI
jgi:hypothetical protein